MNLAALRAELDAIDGRVLALVAERLRVVGRIKAEKQKSGRHLFDRAREQHVLQLAEARGAELGLDASVTRALMSALIDASHSLQESSTIEGETSEGRRILIVGGDGNMGRLFGSAFSVRGHCISVIERHDQVVPAVVAEADIVMIAVPMTEAAQVCSAFAPLVRSDALLCDINSLKVDVCQAMAASRGEALGMHPMFGPTVGSLRRQKVVLCSVKSGPMASWLETELGRMGADLVHASAEHHDAMMAVVQVLTHFGMMVMGRALSRSGHSLDESLRFTSPIYRLELSMVGRLFSQQPGLYHGILTRNPASHALRAVFLEEAQRLSRTIDDGDTDEFLAAFEEVHRYFTSFSEEAMELSDHIIATIMARP